MLGRQALRTDRRRAGRARGPLLAAVALAPLLPLALEAQQAERPELVNRYISQALQGDLSRAESLFANLEERELAPEEYDLLERFRQRFVTREEKAERSGSALVDAVVAAFRRYWTSALMGEAPEAQARATLDEELRKTLRRFGAAAGDAPLDRKLRDALEKRGWHVLTGVTQPFRELMLWRSETEKTYRVKLTDGVQRVRVVFLDDFLVLGWSHFATFGKAYSGGWTRPDALYVIAPAYDIGSERFRVNYLKHEARHFADIAHYPRLRQADLEYRAKLTELVFAEERFWETLSNFINNAAANENAPHAYANHTVVANLSSRLLDVPYEASLERWLALDKEDIRAGARKLLAEHTRAIEAGGPKSIESIIVPEA